MYKRQALTHLGRVYTWGANDRGQRGIAAEGAAPALVGGLDTALAIAAGGDFSLAVLPDGSVRAWGANGTGQLGLGDFQDRAAPARVAGLERIVRVVAAPTRAAAIDDTGGLWILGGGETAPRRVETPGEVVDVQLTADTAVGEGAEGSVWLSSPAAQKIFPESRFAADGTAATVAFTRPSAGPDVPGVAALIVGGWPLPAGDAAIEQRLVALGLNVQILRPAEARAAGLSRVSIVVISSSANAGELDPEIAALRAPVVTWDSFAFGALGLTSTARRPSHGVEPGTSLSIVRPEHPLAAGLRGERVMLTGRAPLAWGLPTADAVVVAVGPSGRPAVFGYERGAALSNRRAPARRVGLFLPTQQAAAMTADAWALFDAGVRWGLGVAAAPAPRAARAFAADATATAAAADADTIVFVVGNVALSEADEAMRDRMVALGLDVVPRAAAEVQPSEAEGKALVFVSSSSNNADVLAKFAYVKTPVVIQSAGIVDDMMMAAPTARGGSPVTNEAEVATSTHPIAAGLSGRQTISADGSSLAWGTPSADGVRVLNVSGLPSQAVVFTYAADAAMAGLNAPARRVFWGFLDPMPQSFTAAGEGLFDRMILWASGRNAAPTVDAGVDLSVAAAASATLGGTVNDDGLPGAPSALTVQWTMESGPGTVTFASPSSASTTATFSAVGTYVLKLAASDGALDASDTTTVVVYDATLNTPPSVGAGADVSTTLGGEVTLAGTTSDDGLPSPPAALTFAWTQVSGPGTTAFTPPNAETTKATFTKVGTYRLRLTVSDSALSASDDVEVTVTAPVLLVVGQTPLSAGDKLIEARFKSFGLGVAVKAAASTTSGDATGRAAVWISSTCPNGDVLDKFAYVGVPVAVQNVGIEDDMNMSPGAFESRGHDFADRVVIEAPSHALAAGLSGTAPISNEQQYAWGIPAPAGVNVARIPGRPSHAVIYAYESGQAMHNGQGAPARRLFFGFRDAALATVQPAGERLLDAAVAWLVRSNAAPWVDAGADASAVLSGATVDVALHGTSNDDGLPGPPSASAAQWTQVSGPASVTFADDTARVTTATFSALGDYVLELAVSDGAKIGRDRVTIHITASVAARPSASTAAIAAKAAPPAPAVAPSQKPPTVSAGRDRTVRLPEEAALAAVVTEYERAAGALRVEWTRVSGPGAVAFETPSSLSTAATFSARGTYVLRVLVRVDALTASDTIEVVAE